MSNLPPRRVLEAGRIDPSGVTPLPWEEPIWTMDAPQAGGRIVLSRKSGRTDGSLEWESQLLDALEDVGFPSTRSIKLFDGKDHIAIDGFHFVVRAWLPGSTLVELGDADLWKVGRFLAELHDATADISLPQRPAIDPMGVVLRSVSDGQLAIALGGDEGVARYRTFVEDVASIEESSDRTAPIHGDFTTRNIVADGSPPTITGVIDFGMAMVAAPVVDLAYALGSTRWDYGAVEHRPERVTELLAGYASKRALPEGSARRMVDYARARPLLHIAMRARADRPPRSEKSLQRTAWLTEHAEEMIAAIERGMSAG